MSAETHDDRDPRVDEHLAVFRRGASDLIEEGELARRIAAALEEGRPLRIKFGMDPSSPDLHMGHAVQLFKLRDLQRLGHTIVLIVGDATARVGDPSGRNVLRPQLSAEEVEANMHTYREQAGLVLDLDAAEVRYNSEWFDPMRFGDVLQLCTRMTVARMLERDTFQKRTAAGEPIGIHEFLYPLMQGWDSVQVQSDVEVGGSDQLFNLHVGRQVQEQVGQAPQVLLTHPLIEGTDGRKMSKSYGNAIGLTDPPEEMFRKVLGISDAPMAVWYTYLTRIAEAEIEAILAGHPMEAKLRLAAEITAGFHGAEAAGSARARFDREVRQRELPEEIAEHPWPGGPGGAEELPLSVLLRELGLVATGGEARRIIAGGGVRLDGQVVDDPRARVAPPADSLLLQVGKRRFARVRGAS